MRLSLLASGSLAAALALAPAAAKEGMWTPDQLPDIADDLRATGLALDPETLTDLTAFPMGAVISLDFCTASFVSPQGLLVTNHHCAQGSIQFNSSEDENLLDTGFLAASLEEEVRAAPNTRVYVTVAVEDVTKAVIGELDEDLQGRARYDAIDRRGAPTSRCACAAPWRAHRGPGSAFGVGGSLAAPAGPVSRGPPSTAPAAASRVLVPNTRPSPPKHRSSGAMALVCVVSSRKAAGRQ